MDWFASGMAPFTVALLVAGGLLAIELVGAMLGAMLSDLIDGAFDFDGDADAEGEVGMAGPLGWLGVGRVPLLIVLLSLLTAFGLAGVIEQWAARAALGAMLPGWLASVGALAAAVPATRVIASGLARVMPQAETQASAAEGFVGRTAKVGAATARIGLPAEAKLTDAHGQDHYVRVVPAEGDALAGGTQVLLVGKTGGVFDAIPDPAG